jgi:hypothetical protein
LLPDDWICRRRRPERSLDGVDIPGGVGSVCQQEIATCDEKETGNDQKQSEASHGLVDGAG